MQPVPLSTRKHLAFLLLVGPGKVKSRNISPGIYEAVAHHHIILPAGDHLINRKGRIDCRMRLIDIAENHCLSNLKISLRRFFLTHDHPEKGCLPGPVRTDNAHYAVGRKVEFKALKEELVTKRLGHTLRSYHLIPEPWTVRDKYLESFLLGLHILVEKVFVSTQTGLRF